MNWLKEEVHGVKLIKLIGIFLLIDLIYNYLVALIFTFGGVNLPDRPVHLEQSLLIIYLERIYGALIEELLFRLLPLAIALECGLSNKKMLGAIILSSVIIFGLIHGSIICIFVQGVSGAIYAIVFLKCGGYQKKFYKALASSTSTHFLFNATIITSVFIAHHGHK